MRHTIRLTALLALALALLALACPRPAMADGTNQFGNVQFTSYNGPGVLSLDRFLTTGPRLAAWGAMSLDEDPELGIFGYGFYVQVLPADNGIDLIAVGVGRLTDPTTIHFTYGFSLAQDDLLDEIRAELAGGGNIAALAGLLNGLRGLYP